MSTDPFPPLRRIAYVEDEPDIRTIAEIALTRIGGFELAVCQSGEEALERIPGFGPDMILLDVMMPGMDGMETFRRLCAEAKGPAAPTVFMTAKAQSHEVARYRALGALGVIVKPFDPLTLAERLTGLWRDHLALAQEPSHAG